MRGGSGVNYSLSPANYDGQGTGLEPSTDVQFAAGMAGGRRRRRSRRARSSRRGGARRRTARRARKSRRSRR